jgi:hypothetical protein
MTETPKPCVRCGYDGEAGLIGRVMLLVDKHERGPDGWGTWRGGKFFRGASSGSPLYWVCERCHAPGEAIQQEVRHAGSPEGA